MQQRHGTERRDPTQIPEGRHVVTLDFNYDGGGVGKGGQATLTVDGEKVASEHLPQTIAYRMSLDETLDIGEDTGTPISEDYKVPFKFAGKLEKITINITEEKLTRGTTRAIPAGTREERHRAVINLTWYVGEYARNDGLANL